jgi:DNA-binding response OmpR family regulator
MPHVLIVHDSESARSELARELQAEGFQVAEADSASAAVREIWQGTYDAALVADRLTMNGTSLEDHIKSIAPEIVTLAIGRESPARLARKVADILDGAVAA